jgi:hypothetical protein
MPFYVKMNDNFMSGWGMAKGKTNVYQVECDTLEQATQIKNHALTRGEMSDITIRSTPVDKSPHRLITEKHYSDLGGCWIEDGGRL